MSKYKRKSISTIMSLLEKPKWWNEAFAKYDQKKLRAWANQQRANVLKPIPPKLEATRISLSDELLMREFYKPYVARNNLVTGITAIK